MFDWTEIKERSKSFGAHKARPAATIPPTKFHRFSLDELDHVPNPGRDENWFPEHVTPWFYLPSYARLSRKAQIRYNQFYALGNHEAFIALELEFIYPIFQEILRTEKDPELAHVIRHFSVEEKKHAEMFARVNRRAEPELYADSNYYLLTLGGKDLTASLRRIGKHWRFFGVWIWIALFFEERSLMYGKEYLREKSGAIAGLFRETHRLHMLEELYHVQADEILIDRFYRPLGFLKRKLTAWMLGRIVQSYFSPKKLSGQIAKVLEREFPNETPAIRACLLELPSLSGQPEFHRQSFGPDATKRLFRQLRQFPEMRKLARHVAPWCEPEI